MESRTPVVSRPPVLSVTPVASSASDVEDLDSTVSLVERAARRGSGTSVEGAAGSGRCASDMDLCLAGRCGRGLATFLAGLRGTRGGKIGGGGEGAL